MKHENEPEGLPVCNFCDKEYDPHDKHICAGNMILPEKERVWVEEESDESVARVPLDLDAGYVPADGVDVYAMASMKMQSEVQEALKRNAAMGHHPRCHTVQYGSSDCDCDGKMGAPTYPDFEGLPGGFTIENPPRVPGYESLEAVLYEAYQQAATGKGAARHGRGVSFDAQPTQAISILLGTDAGLAFQAMKKINEGMRLDPAAKKKELLGAINYIASIIIFMNQEKS